MSNFAPCGNFLRDGGFDYDAFTHGRGSSSDPFEAAHLSHTPNTQLPFAPHDPHRRFPVDLVDPELIEPDLHVSANTFNEIWPAAGKDISTSAYTGNDADYCSYGAATGTPMHLSRPDFGLFDINLAPSWPQNHGLTAVPQEQGFGNSTIGQGLRPLATNLDHAFAQPYGGAMLPAPMADMAPMPTMDDIYFGDPYDMGMGFPTTNVNYGGDQYNTEMDFTPQSFEGHTYPSPMASPSKFNAQDPVLNQKEPELPYYTPPSSFDDEDGFASPATLTPTLSTAEPSEPHKSIREATSKASTALETPRKRRRIDKTTLELSPSVCKPRKDPSKPWCRVNTSTIGSTRTGKINTYVSSEHYVHLPPPQATWISPRNASYIYKYTSAGYLDNKEYTIDEIHDFIMYHPVTSTCKLKLWLQRKPTDSGRRFTNEHDARCRFRDCPANVHHNANIIHGMYQVAFDETTFRQGPLDTDPSRMAGWVHLYCLERFLDFPAICRTIDIDVDWRENNPREPRERWAGAMDTGRGTSVDGDIARSFISACRSPDPTAHLSEIPDYPSMALKQSLAAQASLALSRATDPAERERLEEWYYAVYTRTLSYKMTVAAIAKRPAAQIKQFKARKTWVLGTCLLTHRGDVEMHTRAKKKKTREDMDAKMEAREDGVGGRKRKRSLGGAAGRQRVQKGGEGVERRGEREEVSPRRSGRLRQRLSYTEGDDEDDGIEEGASKRQRKTSRELASLRGLYDPRRIRDGGM